MCEKNLERKVLSSPSNDDIDEASNDDIDEASNDDIDEETIVNDELVDNDIEEEIIIKPKKRSNKKSGETKKKKRRSRKTKKYGKICKTCGQDILENKARDMLVYKDTYHQFLTKQYCEEHELVYTDHKCKPHWCGDCDYLMRYEIEIQKGK